MGRHGDTTESKEKQAGRYIENKRYTVSLRLVDQAELGSICHTHPDFELLVLQGGRVRPCSERALAVRTFKMVSVNWSSAKPLARTRARRSRIESSSSSSSSLSTSISRSPFGPLPSRLPPRLLLLRPPPALRFANSSLRSR